MVGRTCLLLLGKFRHDLLGGHALPINLRKKAPLLSKVALFGFFRGALLGPKLHFRLFAQSLFARDGFVQHATQSPHFSF